MSTNHSPSYVLLVAALRSEFTPLGLEAMKIQLNEHRYGAASGSLGVLAQAVHDAHDVMFDAGEDVHPAIKSFLDKQAGPR